MPKDLSDTPEAELAAIAAFAASVEASVPKRADEEAEPENEDEDEEIVIPPLAVPAPAAAEGAAEGDDADDAGGDEDGEQGEEGDQKILGKFKTADDLANSYRSLEKKHGQTSTRERAMRLVLQERGYTFDNKGYPVPPATPAAADAAPPAAAPEGVTPRPGERYETIGTKTDGLPLVVTTRRDGTRWMEGYQVDDDNIVMMDEDEWQAVFEKDAEENGSTAKSSLLYTKWLHSKSEAQERKRQDAAVRDQEAVGQIETVKTALKTRIAASVGDEYAAHVIKTAEQAMAGKNIPAHLRGNPEYVNNVTLAICADMILNDLPGYLKDVAGKASGNAAARTKVVATGRATGAPAKTEAAAGAKAGRTLTDAEKKTARDLGVSYEKYAAHIDD